jgi:1-phosphofructokinase family hexose kinase
MKIKSRITTLGLAPAWDLTCRGRQLNWGEHPVLEEQQLVAAGKALNISRALAWLGQCSTAAGWWGQEDFHQMECHLARTCPRIRRHLTPVPGRTRINVTVLDQRPRRELHLRSARSLASRSALAAVQKDLTADLPADGVTVLAGALPGGRHQSGVMSLVRASRRGPAARLVVDAHGAVFRAMISAGLPWLIKPNVAELRECLASEVPDRIPSLVKAARLLQEQVPHLLISRGGRGAVLVTTQGAWAGRCVNRRTVVSTVGCGDYLLAGFLRGLQRSAQPRDALATALKVASARAWGWTGTRSWKQSQSEIQIHIQSL